MGGGSSLGLEGPSSKEVSSLLGGLVGRGRGSGGEDGCIFDGGACHHLHLRLMMGQDLLREDQGRKPISALPQTRS